MALTRRFAQPLTQRELQVVSLVRKAMRNKEIAHKLSLTEGTVKEYLFMIFRKVGVKNRTELALWALEKERVKSRHELKPHFRRRDKFCTHHLHLQPVNSAHPASFTNSTVT